MIFDKVSANPTKSVVEEGGKFARENGCDFVVALSGEDSQLIYTRADIEFIFYATILIKGLLHFRSRFIFK